MASVNAIRSAFLDFFAREDHEIVPSSPLVPHNDPTLLFTNAGMVQFKNVFTGVETRPYHRAVTAQKCVRAGGKHNDLDNVGYTARHHTFFEMLGNFSFGDYFKERAIDLAWRLVTEEYGLPKERLLVTVYVDDDVAFDLWKKIAGLPDDRILRIAGDDNFWAMGETGPCGPCSEIFYDHGPEVAGGPPGSADEEGDRFIEIWNLVFMQYEQVTPTERRDLPRPSIDTGMGLERIAAVLQGRHDNYEIDLFARLIEASEALTGTPARGGELPSHKVIADHLRAASFLIADGVMPAPEGRGYVLRRIMRRGMRHAHLLGAREPLMHRLVPTLVHEMGQAYPELIRAEPMVREVLELEETNFRRTLERGLRLLDENTEGMRAGDTLAGEVAFKLYDTYGFPLDLTQDALRAKGIGVDMAGFEAAMEQQRAQARASWKGSGEAALESIWFDLRDELGARVDRLDEGERATLIANQTPFYAEAGGQQGDTGVVVAPHGRFRVEDTQKVLGDLWLHLGRVEEGHLVVGGAVEMRLDAERRAGLRRAHSATHLLHAALRGHLGPHVAQRGSLVAPDRLRFDFSHPKPLAATELETIEREVNAYVRQNAPTHTRIMNVEDALAAGAMALFGEKYGDEVRVVSMGETAEGDVYSMELCGGTHAHRTGDLGVFKLAGDSAVAAGVRRVEALTGAAALGAYEDEEATLARAADTLRVSPKEVPQRIEQLLEERRKLERQVQELRTKLASGGGGGEASVEEVAGVKLAARTLDGVPPKDLRGIADGLKQELGSGVTVLVSANEGKAAIVVAVTEDLTDRYDAVDLVKRGVAALGGKGGGGRADFAQGGGPDAAAADDAVEAVRRALAAA
ncbi:MAG: alanine--tRNA ligase [Alphaproteobacteria bacterium]|jgi:alanyl-tRNA synthetase|nr:alanine--tRNA ligase [Alphaproteobacteria bacterium]